MALCRTHGLVLFYSLVNVSVLMKIIIIIITPLLRAGKYRRRGGYYYRSRQKFDAVRVDSTQLSATTLNRFSVLLPNGLFVLTDTVVSPFNETDRITK